MASTELYILYILLGAIAGMIYSLRRIFLLENKIELMDERIIKILGHVRKKR